MAPIKRQFICSIPVSYVFFLLTITHAVVGFSRLLVKYIRNFQDAKKKKRKKKEFCRISAILSDLASVFTLAMISVERFFAIGWPLDHRRLQKRVYFSFIGLGWMRISFRDRNGLRREPDKRLAKMFFLVTGLGCSF